MKQVTGIQRRALLCIMLLWLTTLMTPASGETDKDIRKLTQHFISPDSMDPWMFVPEEKISEISTSENPGYVTIREAGEGQDIKGILGELILFSDYPLPWQFHMGIVQSYLAAKGLVDEQINWAIGLNLAVTFSDPSTWPSDRSQRPPDTRDSVLCHPPWQPW